MPHVDVEGVAVHYRESGSGPAVVLLHGGGSSGAQWRRVVDLLRDRYRMVTVDHYGHGGTDPWNGPPQERTHDAEAELVLGVIARIGAPVHLVGHSYGGGVSLRLTLRRPDTVRSLTLIEPIVVSVLRHGGEPAMAEDYARFAREFIDDAQAGNLVRAWERFIDGNSAPGSWARMPPEARDKMLALTQPVVSGWYANLNHATTPGECREIDRPTLLLHGEATQAHFRRICELLAGAVPQAQMQILPGAGHMSPLTHPETVAAALDLYLQQHLRQ